jgi:hypothetical protein
VRFSKNKDLYKTSAGVAMTRSGSKNDPGVLYFHLSPEECFFAAGFYMPDPRQLARLRTAAARAPKAFKQMTARLMAPALKLSDEGALKRAPRGFEDADGPEIAAAVRLKSFICLRPVREAQIRKPALVDDFCLRFRFAAAAPMGLGRAQRFAVNLALWPSNSPASTQAVATSSPRQRIFFAASAAPDADVNLSPRGTDAFAVLDDMTVAYLDRMGSGNETAAHLRADGRLTRMFCAFDGPPNILRLSGRGEVLRRGARPVATF